LFSPEGKSGTKKLGKVGISQIGQGDGEKVELVFFKWNEGEGSCKHIPNGSTDGFCVELTEAAGTTEEGFVQSTEAYSRSTEEGFMWSTVVGIKEYDQGKFHAEHQCRDH
jgi:hypothetical protein